jgi:NodT family efflux transporter outer membrane factor (OMF) lipoprotein
MPQRRALFASAMLGLLACNACSTLPDLTPTPPPIGSDWVGAPAPENAADMTNWWKGFNDPLLDQLVDEAMSDGASVRAAALRIREARALSRQTIADYLPIIGLGANGSYARSVDGPELVGSFQSFINSGGGQGGNVVREKEQGFASYGPTLSWEIPLFARIEAAAVGSRANITLALADQAGVRAALAADVAQTYVEARAARQRLAALQEGADFGAELARLTQIGAQAGFVAPADAADAERLAQTLKSRLPDANIALTQFIGSLSVLRGKAPGVEADQMRALFAPADAVPRMTITAPPAAPADLLRLRPDIAVAEGRAVLAGVELGLARADLLPSLRLTGNIGVADNIIGSALPERLIQLEATPVISMPLMGFGRARAAVRVKDARFQQALVNYEQTVITAAGEAGAAIIAWKQGQARFESASAAEAAAERTATGVRAAYGAGIASLSDRLRADQQLIDSRLARVEAERAAALAAIQVYRSFGGGPPLATN